jgi:hypothetical protein
VRRAKSPAYRSRSRAPERLGVSSRPIR